MKALSLRAPWSWAIMYGGKRLENRTWRPLRKAFEAGPQYTIERGQRIAIHTSMTKPNEFDTLGVMAAMGRSTNLPEEAYRLGVIIGTALVVDILRTLEPPRLTKGQPEGAHFPLYDLRPEDQERFLCQGPYAVQIEQLSRWWLGPYAFVLDEVRVFPEPVKAGGALYFWDTVACDDELAKQIVVATPAEMPDWYARSLATASAHDTMMSMVEVDPTMEPGTFEIRTGHAITKVKFDEPAKGASGKQGDLFGEAPTKKTTNRLH